MIIKPRTLYAVKALLICLALLPSAMTFAQAVVNEIGVYYLISADDRNGQGASATNEQLQGGIEQLNSDFAVLNISFVLLDKIYLTNDDVTGINDGNWDDNNEEQVRPFFSYGALNIIVADLDGKNGHAYWNYEATDTIEVEPEDLATSTISHEFGHNLGLLHTYQSIDDGSITLLESENGWQYGDKVIDTAVDPGNRSYFDNCVYTASAVDESGNAYHPDGFNIMGKGQNTCRNSFTAGQILRMERILLSDKFHLLNTFDISSNPTCVNAGIQTDEDLSEGFNYNEIAQNNSWRQDSYLDNFNWKYYNYTSSSSTGAASPQEGHTFLHIDASHELISANDSVNLISPCFTFTESSAAELNFYYSMYGADIGSLSLEITSDDGVSWQNLWQKLGQQHSNGSNWSLATINLNQYMSTPFQLRFSGQVIGGDRGDISLDNISVTSTKPAAQEQVAELAITEQFDLELNVSVYSEELLISTLASEVELSIGNGEYAINCQADSYTSVSVNVSDGDVLCLRHTSSENYQEQVITVLTLAQQSFTFTSTTKVESIIETSEPVESTAAVTTPEIDNTTDNTGMPAANSTSDETPTTSVVATVADATSVNKEQASGGGIMWLLLWSLLLLPARMRSKL